MSIQSSEEEKVNGKSRKEQAKNWRRLGIIGRQK
jgi:hypothetical protein